MSRRPLLLDAFSCAGVGADGYAEHFEIVCLDVDERALAMNPHHVVCGDALRLLADDGFMAQFDVVHASTPCQAHSATRRLADAQRKGRGRAVDLLQPVTELLDRWGGPYVHENVERSPLERWPGVARCCGSSFGLVVQRHRLFAPGGGLALMSSQCDHSTFPLDDRTGKPRPWGVYYSMGDRIPSGGRTVDSWEAACDALGVDHDRLPYHVKGSKSAAWRYLCESIPPSFTSMIGSQIAGQLS